MISTVNNSLHVSVDPTIVNQDWSTCCKRSHPCAVLYMAGAVVIAGYRYTRVQGNALPPQVWEELPAVNCRHKLSVTECIGRRSAWKYGRRTRT